MPLPQKLCLIKIFVGQQAENKKKIAPKFLNERIVENLYLNFYFSAFLPAMLNSFVHVWMYSYYLLAALGYQPKWKKLLTVVQMIQFLLAIVMAAYGLYINCPLPRWMGYTLIGYATSLFVLFANFWLHAYVVIIRRSV